ncbi:MAG: hypothetical protein KJ621_05205 [Proteobacteria bacterium]|nr:hypothetical protein [Pseudomonadota bacterium]MBU1743107.1 hypothetical protein [Pseudomonadota bacterium]
MTEPGDDQRSPASPTKGNDRETAAATARLEAEAWDKEKQVLARSGRVKELMALEAADGQPRAGEIHSLRQQVQVLKWEVQHLRARINRLQNPWY